MSTSANKNVPPAAVKVSDAFLQIIDAASKGKDALIKLLQKSDIKIDEFSNDTNSLVEIFGKCNDAYTGITPLNWACYNNKTDIAIVLIELKANINVKDKFGYTPLHRACVYQNKVLIDLLLKKGASVNAKNIYGNIPLGLKEIIKTQSYDVKTNMIS